jgi:5-methylcytosine-specific restriction enzyme A
VTRPSKLCPHPTCGNTAPCATHSRKPWAGSARDQARRDGRPRSGSREQARARHVLDQADTVCALCGYPGATEVDHIVPLAWGGADDLSNLQAAHKTCHAEKSASERQRGGG